MPIDGLIIGFLAFFIIGVFHPIVIKGEYYFSKKIWPVFLAAGMISLVLSCFTESVLASAALGILGFTCLWSIHEIIEQEKRVERGWFPKKT
jgi:hypothetical protein